MRKAMLLAAVAATLVSVPALGAGMEVPPRKAGQWKIEIIPETTGSAPAITTEVCLDADSDKALMQSGLAMAGGDCQVLSSAKNGDQTVFDSTCTMGPMKTTSHIVISGDFQSSYEMQIISDIEGGPAQLPKHSVMSQKATWTGACTNGMEPGDMLMPGGMKINALKAMNPGG
jgi:hypothetical protein